MSKLIEVLRLQETGNRFAELGTVAVTKQEDYNYFRTTDIFEYRVTATVGVDLRVRPEQLAFARENAEHCIREEVFGEYRKLLCNIRQTAYNRDFEMVNKLVSEIERSMFDVK